jgi:hypothetical protein
MNWNMHEAKKQNICVSANPTYPANFIAILDISSVKVISLACITYVRNFKEKSFAYIPTTYLLYFQEYVNRHTGIFSLA